VLLISIQMDAACRLIHHRITCRTCGGLQVRLIEEAGAQHRKDVRDAKRSAAGRERTASAGGESARIAAALAADRAERAAAAPVR
jgi:hypothetical protein